MNIIIIGASGRIGTELTLYLLRQGHNLALGDLYSGQIKNTIQSSKEPLNNKIFIQDIDMCSEDDYEQWLSNANSKLGSIDGAINCSYPRGKNYGVRLEDVTLETFNNNVSMHLGSYFNFLKATSSFMKSHCFSGPIICTSSITHTSTSTSKFNISIVELICVALSSKICSSPVIKELSIPFCFKPS